MIYTIIVNAMRVVIKNILRGPSKRPTSTPVSFPLPFFVRIGTFHQMASGS